MEENYWSCQGKVREFLVETLPNGTCYVTDGTRNEFLPTWGKWEGAHMTDEGVPYLIDQNGAEGNNSYAVSQFMSLEPDDILAGDGAAGQVGQAASGPAAGQGVQAASIPEAQPQVCH